MHLVLFSLNKLVNHLMLGLPVDPLELWAESDQVTGELLHLDVQVFQLLEGC